ncbi:MAG: S-adenosylmethionine:tRNA ribosyltransferase-isomerase [Legionellaceae bacterium]
MKLSDFNFDIPKDLIALYPNPERSSSRLLCLNGKTGDVNHTYFSNVIDFLTKDDLLIFNNTKVIPARLFGEKNTGGKVEILVERILSSHQALVHIRASKTPKDGTKIFLDKEISIEVLGRQDNLYLIHFLSTENILSVLQKVGHIPLPPYIDRQDTGFDVERYQTVYAKQEGAVAAPTAGLHFDENLLQKVKDKGIDMDFVTLHVGSGTFQPVRCDIIENHKMHSEYMIITESVCEKIRKTKSQGGNIIAVGTTSLRCLETASQGGDIVPYEGETDIFIYPGYKFHCVDKLITNFHLPQSTLLMLVSAFSGYDNIMAAYQEAIKQGYRFYSYGDGMLLSKAV